jgi:hypothetical protein
MDTDALRVFVEAVDREISGLLPGQSDAAQPHQFQALRTSWGELVDWLALGPAPQLRTCPKCGHSGMRDATLCGYCWEKLPTLAPLAAG